MKEAIQNENNNKNTQNFERTYGWYRCVASLKPQAPSKFHLNWFRNVSLAKSRKLGSF